MAGILDAGAVETDKEIEKLEKKLKKVYKEAAQDLSRKTEDYLKAFAEKDKVWQEAVKRGEKSAADYKKWRTGQIMMGNRWAEMRDTIAQDLTNTNGIAMDMIRNEGLPQAYAINHNFGTYQIETGSGQYMSTSYTLYDRDTVKRLVKDNPDLLPKPSVNIPKDLKWNKQKLNGQMLQGILQGESIQAIAKRLTNVAAMDYRAAVRNARTMMTNAQSAGRYDSYRRAKKMGIDFRVMWIATLDGRTRHEHRMLDGQLREVDEPFEVDGQKILYPAYLGGKSYKVPPELVYNCRCTIGPVLRGLEDSVRDLENRNTDRMDEMSYDEWKNALAFKNSELIGDAYGPAYTKAQRKAINRMYDSMPDFLKRFYRKFSKGLKPIVEADQSGKKSGDFGYFSPWEGRVHFLASRDVGGRLDQNPFELGAHEYGHNMDWLAGGNGRGDYLSTNYRSKDGRTFGQIINDEWDERVREAVGKTISDDRIYEYAFDLQLKPGGSVEQFTRSTLYEWRTLNGLTRRDPAYVALNEELKKCATVDDHRRFFMNHKDLFNDFVVKDNKGSYTLINNVTASDIQTFCKKIRTEHRDLSERGCISDMFETYSVKHGGPAYPFGIGHGKTYTSRDGALEKEAFAEITESILANDKSLKVIQKYLPKTFDAYVEMVTEAAK